MPKFNENFVNSLIQTMMEESRQKQRMKEAKQPTLSKAKKSKPEECRFLKLKVSLKRISPPIGRSFVISNHLTFADLHEALQVIMGWENCHLYEFTIGKRPHVRTLTGKMEEDIISSPFGGNMEDAADFDLSFLNRKEMKFTYTYDFGDSWEHEIIVEDANYDYSGDQLVFVLSGKRNCPQEDCGGVYGYYEILNALKNPQEQEVEYLEWIGDYDPEEFNFEYRNMRLAQMFGKPQKSPCKKCTEKNVKKKK